MHPQKNIKIEHETTEYSFVVDLSTRQLETIISTPIGSRQSTIIGMYAVPDRVQLQFYRVLRKLIDEYTSSNPTS